MEEAAMAELRQWRVQVQAWLELRPHQAVLLVVALVVDVECAETECGLLLPVLLYRLSLYLT